MLNRDAWQFAAPTPHSSASLEALRKRPGATRLRVLFEISQILQSKAPHTDRLVAEMLADIVADPDFTKGLGITGSRGRYTRHPILNAPDHCVLAIVWMPGQMSPVHSHNAWCALGVHAGTLTETHFEPRAGALETGLRLSGCRQLYPGDTSHGPARDRTAHRMANLGVEQAISIHVYGVPFERLGCDLNQVWAD